jgi:hypothetical protein
MLNIDGGVLGLIDVDTGMCFEIRFSESDMDFLKERFKNWSKSVEIKK